MKLQTMLCALVLCTGSPAFSQQVLTVQCYTPLDEHLKAALSLWKKSRPDVEVRVQSRNYMDHHNTLLTNLATGSGAADVVCVEDSFVVWFSESQRLEDLLKAPYHAGEHQHKVTPHAWMEASSPEGGLHHFPVNVAPGTLFYRQDVLRKAGVTPGDLTKSWDTFLTSGVKIKEKTGVFLMHDPRFLVQAYLRSSVPEGESLYFDRQGNPTLTSKRFVEAFTLAKKVRDLGLDARVGEWGPEWTQVLSEGKIATQMFGSWFEGHMEELFPDTRGLWRASDLPQNTFVNWGGDFLAIPSQGKQKDLAWAFIQFLSLNREVQLTAFNSKGVLPVLKAAQQGQTVQQPLPFLGMQAPQPMWIRAARQIRPVPPTKYDVVIQVELEAALSRVLEGKTSIQQALQEVQGWVLHWRHPRR